jgi:hypothetical protein
MNELYKIYRFLIKHKQKCAWSKNNYLNLALTYWIDNPWDGKKWDFYQNIIKDGLDDDWK